MKAQQTIVVLLAVSWQAHGQQPQRMVKAETTAAIAEQEDTGKKPQVSEVVTATTKTPVVNAMAKRAEAKLVEFPGPDGMKLHGFLYVPEGAGPFPALLWNHGSGKSPGWQPELAQFYTSQGFVFFIPHRHGQGRSASAGEYHVDAEKRCPSQPDPKACRVKFHELYNRDVVAAVEWLKQRPFVDSHRLAMSGVSYGGIQTILTAEKGLGIRGFVPFSPGAMSWANEKLRERLLEAVQNAGPPIFMLQAKGDYSIGPFLVLGVFLLGKGGLNSATLYPQFGSSNEEAHGAFAVTNAGIEIWKAEVLTFLNAAAPPQGTPSNPPQ